METQAIYKICNNINGQSIKVAGPGIKCTTYLPIDGRVDALPMGVNGAWSNACSVYLLANFSYYFCFRL